MRAYPPRAHGRLSVLPGISGLWQVSGRAEVGFDEMAEMDLASAADGRLSTDLAVLSRTVCGVITGRGAY